jgi:hypothetical protein
MERETQTAVTLIQHRMVKVDLIPTREVRDPIARGKRLGLLIRKIHHKDGDIIIIND